jgi:serine/threonine protein kinase
MGRVGIMEYAEGGSVQQQLEAHGGKLDWDPQQASHKAWVVAGRMLEALRVASKAYVVHRDCKPDNMFLSKQGDLSSAKLGDFGTALRVLDADTQGRTLVYTPGYEAPEMVDKLPSSSATDAWLLGCSLLTMLTGQPPFYYASHLPPEERKAWRHGGELVRPGSPYCDPDNPDYDQVGRHLTQPEREVLQKLLQEDSRRRLTLRQAWQSKYFLWGPHGQPVESTE